MSEPAEQLEPEWVQDARALVERCERDLKTLALRRSLIDGEAADTRDVMHDVLMELLAAGYEL